MFLTWRQMYSAAAPPATAKFFGGRLTRPRGRIGFAALVRQAANRGAAGDKFRPAPSMALRKPAPRMALRKDETSLVDRVRVRAAARPRSSSTSSFHLSRLIGS